MPTGTVCAVLVGFVCSASIFELFCWKNAKIAGNILRSNYDEHCFHSLLLHTTKIFQHFYFSIFLFKTIICEKKDNFQIIRICLILFFFYFENQYLKFYFNVFVQSPSAHPHHYLSESVSGCQT